MRMLGGQQAQIARHSALSPLDQQRVKCIMTSSRSPSQATWIATDSSTQDHQRLGVVQLATSRSHQESKQEQVSSRCCTSARSVQQLLSSNLVNGNMCTPPGKKTGVRQSTIAHAYATALTQNSRNPPTSAPLRNTLHQPEPVPCSIHQQTSNHMLLPLLLLLTGDLHQAS